MPFQALTGRAARRGRAAAATKVLYDGGGAVKGARDKQGILAMHGEEALGVLGVCAACVAAWHKGLAGQLGSCAAA